MTTRFDIHTTETAPEGAQELLGAVEQQLGNAPSPGDCAAGGGTSILERA